MKTLYPLRIYILWCFALLFAPAFVSAQTYWINAAGGPTIDEGMDISLDGAGNSYITGYFTTACNFGTTTLLSNGVDDVFLAKLDVTGQYQWAVKAGGTGSERGLSIKTDATGNSYITGYFYGTATFGSINITSAGSQDIFIAKYDNTGTCLWAKSAGGAGSDIGNGITVDNSGNVIVTGEFAGTATFGSTTYSSMNGSTDVFTSKLDGNGNFLWTKKGSAHLTDRGIDVTCDATGNIYITGQFSDTITFDVAHQNNMLNAVFTVKYDPAGNETWFRKIGAGAMNVSNSITSDGTGIYLVGDFQGTITFFGSSNTNLTSTYANCIFLARYDQSGNLSWSVAESSDSPLTARSVSVNGSNVFIGGHFKCTFDSYSDRYLPANFNSSGYWDIFMGKYSSANGAWSIARQIGGKSNQTCNGIAGDAGGNPHIAGSYEVDCITPISGSFYGYPSFTNYPVGTPNNIASTNGICGDAYYATYGKTISQGSSDIFVANPLDPNRSLYDYYFHTACSGDFVGTCVDEYNGYDFSICEDTIDVCSQANLYANTNTSVLAVSPNIPRIGPDFTWLWSTGQTSQTISVTTTGNYSVVMTTADGCYTSEDTIRVVVHPPPPVPCVSDNVVVNTNSTNPQDLVICGDSLLLVGGCFAPGLTVAWYGDQFSPSNWPNDSAWIDTSGSYSFIVTDIFGCSNAVSLDIIIDQPLPPLDPAMICLNDSDFNDTIMICDGDPLFFYPYDSLGNPLANFQCIENDSIIFWNISPGSPTATILPYTDCVNFLWQETTAMVHDTGWYTITATLVRTSACGNDTIIFSDSWYVIVLPAPPPIPFNLVITGDTLMCPGDSVPLTVTGGFGYHWSTGDTASTIWITTGGNYYVTCIDTTCNALNCCTISSDIANITINMWPQPIITLLPSSGVICPGDSVQAVCSGTGTFVWSGPNGPIAGNTNSIWITSPGTYNCVVTSPDGCQLLSNTVNIQQYNTPSIQASPAGIICPGDSVTLTLVASNGSFVAWLPPLSGSGLTQVVTSAGTYGVSVQGCSIITTAYITIDPTTVSATITPLSDLTVCEGDSILLGANAGMDSYLWSPGSLTDSIVYVYTDGNYILTTSDSGGCLARDTIAIAFVQNTLGPPVASDTTVCMGMPFTLTAYGTPTIVWSTSNGNPLATGNEFTLPTGVHTDTTFYILTDDGVCRSGMAPLNVLVEECPPLTPNVFSPNGDGTNDVFTLYEPEATGLHVWIYDRWGVLIYEYNDVYGWWDGTYQPTGKMCVDGVYYWIADIDYSGVPGKKSGFVHLLTH
jgi:gliding motility-associated-like protein